MNSNNTSDVNRIGDRIRTALQSPAEVLALPDNELTLTLQLLRRVRLLGRFAVDLKQAGAFDSAPRIVRDQLEGAAVMALARQRVALWELECIARAMRDAEYVQIICTKGCAYTLLDLPNAPGRIFADVDLLVSVDDLDKVERTLERHGWSMKDLNPYDDNYYRLWTHELPPMVYSGRDVEVDIHHNIVPRMARLKPDSLLIIAEAVQIDGMRFDVPCNADLLLHTMVHLMFDSDLADKFRDLVDIHDLCIYFGTQAGFWTVLLDRARKLDLERPLFYSLRYSQALLDTRIPEEVLEETAGWGPLRPALWLMDRIVPRALLPLHPFHRTKVNSAARLMLYIRSFWLRMPPWILTYHMLHKLLVVVGLRISALRSPPQSDQV